MIVIGSVIFVAEQVSFWFSIEYGWRWRSNILTLLASRVHLLCIILYLSCGFASWQPTEQHAECLKYCCIPGNKMAFLSFGIQKRWFCHCLIAWSRAPENLIVAQRVKNFPLYGTGRLVTVLTIISRHWILPRTRWIRSTSSLPVSLRFSSVISFSVLSLWHNC